MKLIPGLRLYSAVSPIEILVVRAPEDEVELTCGGVLMQTVAASSAATESAEGQTVLGKRYTDIESSLEFLCVKAGNGTISVDGRPVEVRSAKALPASD